MAVYFDHPIQTAGLGAALTHHNVEWHRNFSVLAVTSKNESTDADGCVNLYLDEVKLGVAVCHILCLWGCVLALFPGRRAWFT